MSPHFGLICGLIAMSVALSFVRRMFGDLGDFKILCCCCWGCIFLTWQYCPLFGLWNFCSVGWLIHLCVCIVVGEIWVVRCGWIWLAGGCESVCRGGSVCYGGVLPRVGELDFAVCGCRFDGVCGNGFLHSFLTPLASLPVMSNPCKNTSQASPSSVESFFGNIIP